MRSSDCYSLLFQMKIRSYILRFTLHRLIFKPKISSSISAYFQYQNKHIPIADKEIAEADQSILIEKTICLSVSIPYSERTNTYYMTKGFLHLRDFTNGAPIGSITFYLNKEVAGSQNNLTRILKTHFDEAYACHSFDMEETQPDSHNSSVFLAKQNKVSQQLTMQAEVASNFSHSIKGHNKSTQLVFHPKSVIKNLESERTSEQYRVYSPRLYTDKKELHHMRSNKDLHFENRDLHFERKSKFKTKRTYSRDISKENQSETQKEGSYELKGSDDIIDYRIDQLTTQKVQLQTKLKAVKQKLENTSLELSKACRKSEMMQHTLKNQIKELTDKLATSQAQRQRLLYEKNQKMTEYETEEKSRMAAFNLKDKALQEEYKKSLRKIQALQKEVNIFKEASHSLERGNESLAQEQQQLENRLRQSQDERQCVTQEIKQLRKQLIEQQSNRLLLQQKYAGSDNLLTEINILKNRISLKQQTQQSLMNEYKQLLQRYENIKGKLASAEGEQRQKDEKILEYQRILKMKERVIQELQNREASRDQSQKENNEYKEHITKLEKEISILNQRLFEGDEELKKVTANLLKTNEFLMDELNQANHQLNNVERELEKSQRVINDKQADIEDVAKNLFLTKEQCKEKNFKLQTLEQVKKSIEIDLQNQLTSKNLQIKDLQAKIELISATSIKEKHLAQETIFTLQQQLKQSVQQIKIKDQELNNIKIQTLEIEQDNIMLRTTKAEVQRECSRVSTDYQAVIAELNCRKKAEQNRNSSDKSIHKEHENNEHALLIAQKDRQIDQMAIEYKKLSKKSQKYRKDNLDSISLFLSYLKKGTQHFKHQDAQILLLMQQTAKNIETNKQNLLKQIQQANTKVEKVQQEQQHELERLTYDNASKQEQIESLHQQAIISQLRLTSTLELKQEQLRKQEEKFSALQQTLEEQQSEKNFVEQDNIRLLAKIKELQAANEEANKELRWSIEQVEELQAMTKNQDQEISTFNFILGKQEDIIQKEAKVNEELAERVAELQKQLNIRTMEENGNLEDLLKKKQELNVRERNITMRTSKFLEQQETNQENELQYKVEKLINEIKMMKEKINLMEEQTQALENDNQECQQVIKDQSAEIHQIESVNFQLQHDKQTLQREVVETQNTISNQLRIINEFRCQIKMQQEYNLSDLSAKDNQIFQLQQQLSKYRQNIDRQTWNQQTLKSINLHLQSKNATLQQQLVDIKHQLTSEEKEVKGREQKLRDIQQELLEKNCMLEKLQRDREQSNDTLQKKEQMVGPIRNAVKEILGLVSGYMQHCQMLQSSNRRLLEFSAHKQRLFKDKDNGRLRKIRLIINRAKLDLTTQSDMEPHVKQSMNDMLTNLRAVIDRGN